MAFTITDSQQVPVVVQFVTKKGNPAPVDGIPEWTTDNSDVFSLTPAADGMSCVVAAAGPLGLGKVQVTADADLGAGVQHVIGVLDGTVTGGNAATVVLTPGTAEEQPEVTPVTP